MRPRTAGSCRRPRLPRARGSEWRYRDLALLTYLGATGENCEPFLGSLSFAPATDVMTLQRLILTERPPYLAKGRDRASIAAAVRAGARVFLSGQNALSADGRVDRPGRSCGADQRGTRSHRGGAVGSRRIAQGHHQAHDLHRRPRSSQSGLRGDRPAASRGVSGQHRTGHRGPAAARNDGPDRRRGCHSGARRRSGSAGCGPSS